MKKKKKKKEDLPIIASKFSVFIFYFFSYFTNFRKTTSQKTIKNKKGDNVMRKNRVTKQVAHSSSSHYHSRTASTAARNRVHTRRATAYSKPR